MLLELLATERMSVNKMIANLVKKFGPHFYDRKRHPFPAGEARYPHGISEKESTRKTRSFTRGGREEL